MSGSYSLQISRASRSNFYRAFSFLPAEQRQGILAIYAFSRLVDDAVDEAPDAARAAQEIQAWRARLQACYGSNGAPPASDDHPLLPELKATIDRFEIPQKYFLDLLEGVARDLTQKRYESFEELKVYCYHVAGTIGLLCNQVFGRTDAGEYAVVLGRAFQLTNILRDVGTDARQGRIYLPLEDLRRFQYTEQELMAGERNASFFELMAFETARARQTFEEANKILPPSVRRKLVAAEMMAAVYRRLLEKIEEKKYPVFGPPLALARLEKFWLFGKVALRSL